MSALNWTGRSWRAALAMMTLLLALPTAGRAQEVLESGSLQVVPADAAFYGAVLRLGEQVQIFRDSKLYAALRFDPFIQAGVAQAKNMLNQDENFRQFLALMQQPENQQLYALIKQALSKEMFVYGDEGFAEQLALINSLNSTIRGAQFEAMRSGEDAEEILAEKMTSVLLQHADHFAVPLTVFGFRIEDRQAALDQLARLESLLQAVLADQPELKSRLDRKTIGQDEHLVWRLDGSLIPWDEMPRDQFEGDPAQLEILIEKLQKMTLTLSVGVHKDYLILAISKDESHLAQLGQGKSLATVEKMQVLRKYADQRLTGVGYANGEFLQRVTNVEGQMDQLRSLAAGALPLADLGDDLEKRILDLVDDMSGQLAKLVPQPGTVVSVSYMTPRGYEQFDYNWTEAQQLDASQPLTILEHVGGSPILFAAGRTQANPEAAEMFRDWCTRGFEIANDVALAKLSDEERPVYQRLRDKLLPLLQRLDEVNRSLLAPAFADGQFAIVFDARLTTNRLHPAMPESRQPLPIPELGLVWTIRNPEQIKQAAEEYFEVIQQAINVVAEVAPEEVPAITLPPPVQGELAGGEMYSYPLPPALQLDQKLAPNAALTDDTLVISLSPVTSERLLTPTPLPSDGVLAKLDRPLAAASSFHFAGLIDAIIPWLNYGIVQAQGEDAAPAIMGLAGGYLRMMKCFQGANSITYREGDVWITHSETLLQDLQ